MIVELDPTTLTSRGGGQERTHIIDTMQDLVADREEAVLCLLFGSAETNKEISTRCDIDPAICGINEFACTYLSDLQLELSETFE